MDTEDQGDRPAEILCRWVPEDSLSGLWESSPPFPLSVGPWFELEGLLRQDRVFAEQGEGVAVAESGEDATEWSDLVWMFIFSEVGSSWLLQLLLPSFLVALAFPFNKAEG